MAVSFEQIIRLLRDGKGAKKRILSPEEIKNFLELFNDRKFVTELDKAMAKDPSIKKSLSGIILEIACNSVESAEKILKQTLPARDLEGATLLQVSASLVDLYMLPEDRLALLLHYQDQEEVFKMVADVHHPANLFKLSMEPGCILKILQSKTLSQKLFQMIDKIPTNLGGILRMALSKITSPAEMLSFVSELKAFLDKTESISDKNISKHLRSLRGALLEFQNGKEYQDAVSEIKSREEAEMVKERKPITDRIQKFCDQLVNLYDVLHIKKENPSAHNIENALKNLNPNNPNYVYVEHIRTILLTPEYRTIYNDNFQKAEEKLMRDLVALKNKGKNLYEILDLKSSELTGDEQQIADAVNVQALIVRTKANAKDVEVARLILGNPKYRKEYNQSIEAPERKVQGVIEKENPIVKSTR